MAGERVNEEGMESGMSLGGVFFAGRRPVNAQLYLIVWLAGKGGCMTALPYLYVHANRAFPRPDLMILAFVLVPLIGQRQPRITRRLA